mgnify:CR=1 FL=1
MGELQKFTNVIVLDSIVTKVEFIHRNDVFGVIILDSPQGAELPRARCIVGYDIKLLQDRNPPKERAKPTGGTIFSTHRLYSVGFQ